VREDVKMRRCERRCEDEKMFYRPPLLEEPCAQTLSGKKNPKIFLRYSLTIIIIDMIGQEKVMAYTVQLSVLLAKNL